MKKIIPIIVSVVAAIVLLLSFALSTHKTVSTNIENYDNDRTGVGVAYSKMPELDSLGNYSGIKYSYQKTCHSRLLQFYSHGFALFVQYDSETYEKEKTKVLDSYTFLEEPIKDDVGEDYVMPLGEFDYRGYKVHVVHDPGNTNLCKSFAMIGFNDDEGAIVYLYFHDQDLDSIAEKDDDPSAEMAKLLNASFEWIDI